jgi:hypothetical protein
VRLIEGLALPSDEIESRLSYYNSSTTWLDIDQLLAAFGLGRSALASTETVTQAVRNMAPRAGAATERAGPA